MFRNDLIAVPFFESMSRSNLFDVEYAKTDSHWQELKKIYDENYLGNIGKKQGGYKIPKKIHQIWLGGPLPDKYIRLTESWKKFHPNWEYRLWTDDDAKKFPMKNRKLFEKITNLGAKADIFRLEILYKYGGIYADTDFECLKSFDTLVKLTSFFAGLVYDRKPTVANGLISASVKSQIIMRYLEAIGRETCRFKKGDANEIMKKTGPYMFTKVLLESIKEYGEEMMIFPLTFFYPFPSYERFCADNKVIKSYIRRESMAIHYWSASWVEKQNLFGRIGKVITDFVRNFL